LCLQITKDIETYSKYTKGIRTTAVYGGTSIQTQIKALNSGSQIVVGTPGRVIDLIKRKKLKLANIEYVVLDEADEMLNMGFKEDLDTILAETPKEKRTLLFSATMPKEVMRITKNYMFSPKTIEVAGRNEGAENVEHHFYVVNARDRYKALRRICDVNPEIYGIVFCRTRRETKDVADKLMQDGYNADALHGDLSQSQRDHVMGRFRKRNLQMLVATDVAARGIDIDDLTHIINYNLPDDNEIYIHRSGRTGRAGKNGISIIISHSRERRKLQAISKMLKKDLTQKQVPNGEEICAIQLLTLIDKVVKTDVNEQIEKYIPIIEEKLAHLDKEDLLKHFVSAEFNRFLSFYKNAPDLNVSANSKSERGMKNERGRKNNRENKKGERTGHAEKGYTRFFINLGKLQNLEAHNLIGIINEYTRKRNIPIGKIDILRKFSFFEVDSNNEQDVLAGLSKAEWNGNRFSVEISKPPTAGGNDFKRKSSVKGRKRFDAKRKSSSRNRRKNSRRGDGEGSFKDKFTASTKRKKR
jgi:ATP-dependent RNA helicase DeaD